MRRAWPVISVALLVSAGMIAISASPASAATKVPKFTGHAPGLVVCNLTAKVSFAPSLTESGGGTGPSRISGGKLSGCVPTNSDVTITSGKVTGSFASSPLSCSTDSPTGATATLTVKWKGALAGTLNGTTYAGKAKFATTSITGSSGTGSFAGNVTVTVNVPETLSSLCRGATGVKKIAVTGSIAVGSTTGGGGGGGGTVTGSAMITQVVSDGTGYCALASTGAVECWGQANQGELGNGGAGVPSCVVGLCNPTPQTISGLTIAIDLASDGGNAAAGYGYCAVLSTGSVECWGENSSGELGDDTESGPDSCTLGACSTIPVVVDGVSNAKSIVSTGGGYCAILSTSGVACWGADDLGLGSDVAETVAGLTGVSTLASDGNGVCALLGGGAIECWGDDYYGELGDGTDTSQDPAAPVDVTGITNATSVVGNGYVYSDLSYCALLQTGSVQCWGDNSVGELGNGSTTQADAPVDVTGLTDAASLASDGLGYCATLQTTGDVSCWGDDSTGELGNGSTTQSDVPVVAANLTGVSSLSGQFTDDIAEMREGVHLGPLEIPPSPGSGYCAVLSDGDAYCWGDDSTGELGVTGTLLGPNACGAGTCLDEPTQTRSGISSVQGDGVGFCALLTSGGVSCWGDDFWGQLGSSVATSPNAALSASPNTGLVNGQTVGVTGTSLAVLALGSVVECNDTPDQPSVQLGGVVDAVEDVGCTGSTFAGLVETTGGGALSATFKVATGTVGPPCGTSYLAGCPTLDSAGHNPAVDAAAYPCPPTPAQEAAGDTCVLEYGDGAGDLVSTQILFAGESAP